MSADQRMMGDWAILPLSTGCILAVIDSCTTVHNGWKISRYRWTEDFMGNGYWRFHDEDVYWKPSTAPCSRNQPYDKYEWHTGLLPRKPPDTELAAPSQDSGGAS